MLQQTRVDTVIPYYERWIKKYPSLHILAAASLEEVLKAWEGLGYYSRARNIKKTADKLIADHEEHFPRTVKELIRLPGVGDYIAGAIASIAFHQDEIALDGNGIRVFSRLFEFQNPVNDSASRKMLKAAVQEMLPKGEAGWFNQAVMDLGSQICLARKPLCSQCPIRNNCLALKHGSQWKFPIKLMKKPIPHFDVVAAVIRKENTVLIDKRREGGLLGGLWEYPGGKVEPGEDHQAALVREIREELGVQFTARESFGRYEHAYTHYRITVYAFWGEIYGGEPSALEADEIRWAEIRNLQQYPMGKVDRLISLDLMKLCIMK